MSSLIPKVACVTMVYNEVDFLPLWIAYYSKALGIDNLYVIDDGSDDGSTSLSGVNVIRIPKVPFNDERRARFAGEFHRSLLNYYDSVIFVDADEFLVPDPDKYSSLLDYCGSFGGAAATAVGLNVYQVIDEERPIDFSRPIFEQRRHARFISSMCKTAISREAIKWGAGFHSSSPKPAIDDGLYLMHLKYVDMDRSLRRQRVTRELTWDEMALKKNYGGHQRQSDEWVSKHFDVNACVPGSGPEAFSFASLIEEVEAGRAVHPNGIESLMPNVKGPIVRIPDRFVGTL